MRYFRIIFFRMTSLLLFKPTDDQLRKAIDFIFKLYDKDRNKVLDYE